MKFTKVFSFLTLFFFSFQLSSHAYWVWSPEQGKFINPEAAADESTDEDFNRAMKLYKDKNYKEAAEKIKAIIKKNPNAKIAPEALYRLGVIYEEQGDYLKSFKQYQKLVESYPGTERFSEVIERQFRIGNLFFTGKKAKFAGLEILPSLPRAAKVFENIVKTAPYSEYGDKAQFQLGLTYKKMGKFGLAVDALQKVIDNYPQSELIPQVRYQLAETSFQRTSVESRDQRVLDEAGRQVDRYLKRFPGEEESEEAAKIRQAIDEKNAEKNYRIGLYYEKENYLDSALIYYADVASRYKDTAWGIKAVDKLKSLKEPADYLNKQEKELEEQENILRAQIKGLTGNDEERDRLKRKLERVEQHHKSLGKDKKQSIERRREDIARRQRELKLKFKNLNEKRKLLEKNPSEDLKRAIDSWNASLMSEQDDLEKEKIQVKEWSEELGVPDKKFDLLPFVGEGPAPVEKVRRIEAKKLYKLSEEKKNLLEEKELLYKHHNEVKALLNEPSAATAPFQGISEADWKKLVERDVTLAEQKQKADQAKDGYDEAEKTLREKTELYEKQFGKESWLSSGAGVIEKSLDFVNPFDGKNNVSAGDPQQKLLEQRMHLEEKMAAQQSIIQTLNDAFNAQLALQEQRRLLAGMQVNQQPTREELGALRKQLKSLEKSIRSDYEEIQDRHKHKTKILEELEGLLKEHQTGGNSALKAGQTVAAPVVGFAKLSKAFIFGLPEKDVELSHSASKVTGDGPQSARIAELNKEIELDSLIVEAKSREIVNKQKQLEILRAKAALMGGYKFRPAFVKVPYLFIDEAIQSAKRIVPKKEREEMLINRIHEETKKMSGMKKELQALEKAIDAAPASKVSAPAEAKKEPAAPAVQESSKEDLLDQKKLKKEIEQLQGRLKDQHKDLKREQERLEEKISGLQKKLSEETGEKSKAVKKNAKHEKKLRKELEEIESNLKELINRESKLETEETSILEKRIEKIDIVLKKMNSKVLSQDLLTERERMEGRLSQIQSRKDFLSKEMERFRVPEAGAGRA